MLILFDKNNFFFEDSFVSSSLSITESPFVSLFVKFCVSSRWNNDLIFSSLFASKGFLSLSPSIFILTSELSTLPNSHLCDSELFFCFLEKLLSLLVDGVNVSFSDEHITSSSSLHSDVNLVHGWCNPLVLSCSINKMLLSPTSFMVLHFFFNRWNCSNNQLYDRIRQTLYRIVKIFIQQEVILYSYKAM